MNKIKRFFIKRQKRKEYKESIYNHKKLILKAFYEMMECPELEKIIYDPDILSPLWYRALEHDDSKYEKDEFEPYRKKYYPVDEQEKKSNYTAYRKALYHHLSTNDHHWQYRQNYPDIELDLETKLACLENLLD